MKLIAGLGNPGRMYDETRHNIGFMLVDLVAEVYNIPLRRRDFNAIWGGERIFLEEVTLVKPQTFMNLSGRSLKGFVDHFNLSLTDILVVYDDVDLPFERLRIKARGGSGGHKGVESIIRVLGGSGFPRLRLGIGKPGDGDVTSYVLNPFSGEEKRLLRPFLERGKAAIEMIIKDGISEAMNEFNQVRYAHRH